MLRQAGVPASRPEIIRAREWLQTNQRALLAIQAHNQLSAHRIEVVAFPAMGTGLGGMAYEEAARQMAVAYRHYLEPPHRLDWDLVAERQRAICYDGKTRMIG